MNKQIAKKNNRHNRHFRRSYVLSDLDTDCCINGSY